MTSTEGTAQALTLGARGRIVRAIDLDAVEHDMRPILLLTFLASCALTACPATVPVADDDETELEDLAEPPRGADLERAVIGKWVGVAHDGTTTTEAVEVSLAGDHSFELSAGLVNEAHRWEVRDDLVVLLPDPEAQASDGICFRLLRVADGRVEGEWAYTAGGAGADGAVSCKEQWFPVVLERAPDGAPPPAEP